MVGFSEGERHLAEPADWKSFSVLDSGRAMVLGLAYLRPALHGLRHQALVGVVQILCWQGPLRPVAASCWH